MEGGASRRANGKFPYHQSEIGMLQSTIFPMSSASASLLSVRGAHKKTPPSGRVRAAAGCFVSGLAANGEADGAAPLADAVIVDAIDGAVGPFGGRGGPRTIPTGVQMVAGVVKPTEISAIRRGTDILVQNGSTLYYLESSTVNLQKYEDREVQLEGTVELNTDPSDIPELRLYQYLWCHNRMWL